MMRLRTTLAIGALSCASIAAARAAEQTCPVTIEMIDMNYGHSGGQSRPQLRMQFLNGAGKTIANATFQLSILDGDGSPSVYPREFAYSDGLDAGKSKLLTWGLDAERVDIHHTGETVTLKSARFSDGSGWKDDGSESCSRTVDFHRK